MAPFADAMCFVNSKEADLDLGKELNVLLFRERLRCYIQDLGPSTADILFHFQRFIAC